MASNFHKQIQSVISTRKETLSAVTVNSSTSTGLVWTKVDRTDLSGDLANYVVSFNLPYTYNEFSSASTLSKEYPELQQLNVDSFIFGEIHPDHYSEMIDGRSITLTVPQYDATSASTSAKTVISSTYNVLQKGEESILLGKNIAFLFCDEVNLPYTGTTDGGALSRASITSWSATSYLDRPAAVSYQNLQEDDINTDQRPWASVALASTVASTYPTTTNQGYNYDIPVGFACLDKGFVVLTHPDIVGQFPWTAGTLGGGGSANTGGLTRDIGYATNSQIEFYDISVAYKTNVVATALPGEFYFTNNPTWDFDGNLTEYQLGTNNFDDTYVSEIGLYNKNSELIAIAKLDRSKVKGYTNLLTFNLQIDV